MKVTHGHGYVYSIQYHIVWCVKAILKIKNESEVKTVEKAYKYRIYPNKKQKELIHKTFGCTRFVYNTYLAKRIEKYEKDKITFTYIQCANDMKNLKTELG
jgi:putative transposase|uniref:Endonuclease n=1 Tax=virus sp. ctmTa7 TaxID=2828255 RepID=A0A8S5RB52_9VIRU|nr:MAG TPA: endonuclease [virus sp. ctmTa7]